MNKIKREALKDLLVERAPPKNFNMDDICFAKQLEFIMDDHPFVTASCSRRAGKTEACAIDLLRTALHKENATCLYITMTAGNAEKIIWSKLKHINDKFELGGIFKANDLSIRFSNGSIIYLSGCSTRAEVEKFRGQALNLVYIDETQSIKGFIKYLVDDVLGPTLADYAGKLKILGTPNAVPAGFFFDTLQNPYYSHHSWTFFDNPFIATKSGSNHHSILERELKRRSVDISHPSIRREWFGEWIIDKESLVLKYQKNINDYDQLPTIEDYIIAVDIGLDDADAIALMGWEKHRQKTYLIFEDITRKQTITELAIKIEKLVKKYNPLKIVMDTGGLGKKVAEEIRKRFSLPIQAAEKSRKIEYLSLLNDALRQNTFFAKSESQFVQDSYKVEWDYEKSTPDKKMIKTEFHSDIIDAVLYGFRECLGYLSSPKDEPVKINTQEKWMNYSLKLMEGKLEKNIAHRQMAEEEEKWLLSETIVPGSEWDEFEGMGF